MAPTFIPGPSLPATAPAPAAGIRRNSLKGPGYNALDVSLAKAFGVPRNRVLGEGARFEIRADIYNLFNTTNIDVSTIDSAVGTIDRQEQSRTIATLALRARRWGAGPYSCRRGLVSELYPRKLAENTFTAKNKERRENNAEAPGKPIASNACRYRVQDTRILRVRTCGPGARL